MSNSLSLEKDFVLSTNEKEQISVDEFMSLSQEGTVDEYCDEFKFLLNKVKVFKEISEDYATYLFIFGLKPEICNILMGYHNMGKGLKLEQAFSMARLRETALNLDSNQGKSSNLEVITLTLQHKSNYVTSSVGEEGFKAPYSSQFTKVGCAHQVLEEMPKRIKNDIQEPIYREYKSEIGNEVLAVNDDESKKREIDDSKKDENQVEIKQDITTNNGTNINHGKELGKQQGIINGLVLVGFFDDVNTEVGYECGQINHTRKEGESSSTVLDDVDMGINIKEVNQETIKRKPDSVFRHDVTDMDQEIELNVKLGEHVGVVGVIKELGLLKRKKQLHWIDTGWVCNMEYKGSEISSYNCSATGLSKFGSAVKQSFATSKDANLKCLDVLQEVVLALGGLITLYQVMSRCSCNKCGISAFATTYKHAKEISCVEDIEVKVSNLCVSGKIAKNGMGIPNKCMPFIQVALGILPILNVKKVVVGVDHTVTITEDGEYGSGWGRYGNMSFLIWMHQNLFFQLDGYDIWMVPLLDLTVDKILRYDINIFNEFEQLSWTDLIKSMLLILDDFLIPGSFNLEQTCTLVHNGKYGQHVMAAQAVKMFHVKELCGEKGKNLVHNAIGNSSLTTCLLKACVVSNMTNEDVLKPTQASNARGAKEYKANQSVIELWEKLKFKEEIVTIAILTRDSPTTSFELADTRAHLKGRVGELTTQLEQLYTRRSSVNRKSFYQVTLDTSSSEFSKSQFTVKYFIILDIWYAAYHLGILMHKYKRETVKRWLVKWKWKSNIICAKNFFMLLIIQDKKRLIHQNLLN